MTNISIRINGKDTSIAPQCSISQALDTRLETTSPESYVIALNQNFIPRSQYETTMLNQGDELELLSPMAGG